MSDSGSGSPITFLRFEGKPLRQPDYSFRDVPRCRPDLGDSSLVHIARREPFVDSMAEMLLLCKEVMRRQVDGKERRAREEEEEKGKGRKGGAGAGGRGKSKKSGGGGGQTKRRPELCKKRTSKPLSLEYMADRTDVDDPIFGYFVRTSDPTATDDGDPEQRQAKRRRKVLLPPDGSVTKSLRPDMLQGFVTVTTFTNWQTTFRWDSMHDSAFSYDDPDLAGQMAGGERKYDEDGTLAEQMQATVRCGDPWNEGIVWPRIAEISLLGGLGCGKTLINLVIEKLERMAPTGSTNYDFVVLQATENSVPFYEAMGFVRVGAIIEDDKFLDKAKGGGSGGGGGSSGGDGGDTPVSEPPTCEESRQSSSGRSGSGLGLIETEPDIFSSPVFTYVVKKQWERTEEVAARFKVDVYDIIFLNKEVYADISARSWLKRGTRLYVPDKSARYNAVSHALRSKDLDGESAAPLWYVAKENDTPRVISKMFNVGCADLIGANRDRLPGLVGTSRLREGTRVKVSRFDLHDDHHVPYCHWTFPDDTLESTGDPSYMMARKLDRRRGAAAKARPVASSLAVRIAEYKHEPSSEESPGLEPGEETVEGTLVADEEKASKSPKSDAPKEPVKPKRPLTAYMIFSCEQKESLKLEKPGLSMAELKKVISAKWKDLPGIDKSNYQEKSETEKRKYQEALKKYQKDLDEFREAKPNWKEEKDQKKSGKATQSLVNQVVKLNHKEERDAEFEYYYVLTFIPDLQWCHLAPLRKNGWWGPDKDWRPIWMLVDEQEGKEMDISSTFCEPVDARATKNSVDADEEEWDILESRPLPPESRMTQYVQNQNELCGYASRAKPLAPILTNGVNKMALESDHHGKKRKRSSAREEEVFEERPLFTASGVKVTITPKYLHQSRNSSNKRRKRNRAEDVRTAFPTFPCLTSPSELNSSRHSFSGQTKKAARADGTIQPKHPPRKGANGLFKKPRGRTRLGMEWDAVRGLWVPSTCQGKQNATKNKVDEAAKQNFTEEDSVIYEDIPEPGCVCNDYLYYCTIDDESCGMVASKLGCSWRDVANANKDRYGVIKEQSRFEERTLLSIPPMCGVCGKLESVENQPMLLCYRCGAACHFTCTHNEPREAPLEVWFCQSCKTKGDEIANKPNKQAKAVMDWDVEHEASVVSNLIHSTQKQAAEPQAGPDDNKLEIVTTSKFGQENNEVNEVFEPGCVCKDMIYYCTFDDESCEEVASKLGCNWRNLAIANRDRYGLIKAEARFQEGTLLIIPKTRDVAKVEALCKQRGESNVEQEEEVFCPGFVCKDLEYYCTLDDETCVVVGKKIGCAWRDVANANKDRYGSIMAQSRFEEGTLLRIPETHNHAKVQSLCKHHDDVQVTVPQSSKSEKGKSPRKSLAHTVCKLQQLGKPDAKAEASEKHPSCGSYEGNKKEKEKSDDDEEEEVYYPGFVCKDLFFYCTLDNETCAMVADKLGCPWRELARHNKQRYGPITTQSKFEEGTVLRVPKTHDIEKLRALYRYEDEAKLDYCCACGVLETHDGPLMILCDGCNAACHLTCTHDKLSKVPEGDWFCEACAKKKN